MKIIQKKKRQGKTRKCTHFGAFLEFTMSFIILACVQPLTLVPKFGLFTKIRLSYCDEKEQG
jgi:hypothetical protein